jgi:hypothetical protein
VQRLNPTDVFIPDRNSHNKYSASFQTFVLTSFITRNAPRGRIPRTRTLVLKSANLPRYYFYFCFISIFYVTLFLLGRLKGRCAANISYIVMSMCGARGGRKDGLAAGETEENHERPPPSPPVSIVGVRDCTDPCYFGCKGYCNCV